ncbi:MAG: S41 family peptidase [Acidothermus cellulolyticus]|nr:S41 family peptidase [Acidothermus cellulolyticus]
MRISRRSRWVRIGGAVLALASIYSAGVVTGVLGSSGSAPQRPAAAPSSPGFLDQVEQTILRNAAKPVTADELDRSAIRGMLDALDDKWSSYYSAADFASFENVMNGQYTGVGLWVHRDASGAVTVLNVQAGSPADRAGVRSGDVVLAVGGVPVAGRSIADVVTALRGDAGTTVTLTYRRGDVVRTVTMRRSAVASEDVTAATQNGVMIIKVSAFSRGVANRVRTLDALARTQRDRGIVLDLRGNPGGLLEEGVQTASVFLDGGLVATFVRRGAQPVALKAAPGGDIATPLAVLVDGGTASAAEIVAGALQDRQRAVVVGSPTFGKGSVQQPIPLADGSAIEFTVGTYLTPAGRSLDGVGVQPDVPVAANAPPSLALEEAVDVISGLLANAGTSGHG